jgi:predicted lipid-binding transport protein (Tim44 family)
MNRQPTPEISDKIRMHKRDREETPTMTQAKAKPTMLEWLICGGLLGGFAGAVLMASTHKYGEAVWGYAGLALLILGVLIAVTGLLIIAANAIRFPQDTAPQQAAQHQL